MTYTQLAVLGIVIVVLLDLFAFRTRLVTRKVFWVAYAIIVGFQLLTNGVLTGFQIVRYDPDAILGVRIVFAPVEDLGFGFALVLLTLCLWVWWGRRGVQFTPTAGPPIWRTRSSRPDDRDQSGDEPDALGAARDQPLRADESGAPSRDS